MGTAVTGHTHAEMCQEGKDHGGVCQRSRHNPDSDEYNLGGGNGACVAEYGYLPLGAGRSAYQPGPIGVREIGLNHCFSHRTCRTSTRKRMTTIEVKATS